MIVRKTGRAAAAQGFLITLSLVWIIVRTQAQGCGNSTAFELVTGFVYTSPDDLLDNRPGTLFLADCLQACRENTTCTSANFETGLCVLFGSDASRKPNSLHLSQFPVFTMYAQKVCIRGSENCASSAWAYERVSGYAMVGYTKKTQRVASRFACFELCLKETDFVCRSVNFNVASGECALNDMDRFSASSVPKSFQKTSSNQTEYLENNCIQETLRMCDFLKSDGKILKTVDSLIQNVTSLDSCRQLCINSETKCRTFDWSVTGEDVCRLSHHAASTLLNIEEPYLEAPRTSSFELGSCYNVSVQCRASDMVAKVHTNKIFNGKVYAKSKPITCMYDVKASLDFQLLMPYNDPNCDVKRQDPALFTNDIVLQHHDMVVTNLDLGMSIHCQYDLKNKSIGNTAGLNVQGDVGTSASESANVSSPNVHMKITDRSGDDVAAASVGDPLSLRFEIVDKNSPYEIFVRELIAQDGTGGEILLIDSLGCPTDGTIMGALGKADESGKVLAAPFDAFKFPSSEVVQFKALVTPCLPACAPVDCNVQSFDGTIQTTQSFGRRRKRQTDSDTFKDGKMIVMQKIRITDNFSPGRQGRKLSENVLRDNSLFGVDVTGRNMVPLEDSSTCLNVVGIAIGCTVFILAQIIILTVWVLACNRRNKHKRKEVQCYNNRSIYPPEFANFAPS